MNSLAITGYRLEIVADLKKLKEFIYGRIKV